MLKTDRSIVSYILLSFVTCGIYAIYYWYKAVEDLNTVAGNDGEESPNYIIVWLLSMVTCSIYNYIWFYKQGNRLQRVIQDHGGVCNENGQTYVIINLFALLFPPILFLSYYLFFKNLNTACTFYNNGGGGFQPNQYR